MTTLQQFSDALADAAAAAGQHLVRVEARRRMPASGIVWGDGLIITAHHVVEKSEGIKVGLPDGSTTSASLIGRDPSTDIAVLRAETELSGIAQAANPARVGSVVLAVARPGKDIQASFGIITAHVHLRQEHALQADLVMYPGFSGGALINTSGQLVGMNTSATGSGSHLALPLDLLRRVVGQIQQHGKIKRGYIGVSLQPVRLTPATSALTGQSTGLMIVSVEQDGPADSAGLHQGDIIVSFDGQKTTHVEELLGLLNGERVGRPAAVQVVRGGQAHTLSVTVTERD